MARNTDRARPGAQRRTQAEREHAFDAQYIDSLSFEELQQLLADAGAAVASASAQDGSWRVVVRQRLGNSIATHEASGADLFEATRNAIVEGVMID